MKKTLIALIALASVAMGYGTGEFSVPTGGNFAAGNYIFDFSIDENDVTYSDGVISTLNGGTVLALYGIYSTGDYTQNGFVLGVQDGAITLSVGRGKQSGLASLTAPITTTTTFTINPDGVSGGMFMNEETPLTLNVGTRYTIVSTLEIVSAPQSWNADAKDFMQHVSIYETGSAEALATVSYKGNMGGGDANTAMAVWGNSAYNVIPEPATATLSLLALAGLAARRRRK